MHLNCSGGLERPKRDITGNHADSLYTQVVYMGEHIRTRTHLGLLAQQGVVTTVTHLIAPLCQESGQALGRTQLLKRLEGRGARATASAVHLDPVTPAQLRGLDRPGSGAGVGGAGGGACEQVTQQ